jgi:hypothetical protein
VLRRVDLQGHAVAGQGVPEAPDAPARNQCYNDFGSLSVYVRGGWRRPFVGAFCHIFRPAWQNARRRKSVQDKEFLDAPTILPFCHQRVCPEFVKAGTKSLSKKRTPITTEGW